MVFEYCEDEFQCENNLICLNSYCVCPTFLFEYNGSCSKCIDYHQPCQPHDFIKCCASSNLACIDNFCQCRYGDDSPTCNYNGSSYPMFISASQIALSAALIMGMAALTMVVYRLCTKPRYLSARQRALASQMGFNIDNETLSYATYLRASLTSMQIRVLTRMRDRPPTYDNRPAPIALPEAPPPYEGDSEGIALPPPYIEVVVSPTGYTNSTFIEPEPDVQNNRNTVCPNCDANQQRRIDISSDKETKTDSSGNEKTENRGESQINNV